MIQQGVELVAPSVVTGYKPLYGPWTQVCIGGGIWIVGKGANKGKKIGVDKGSPNKSWFQVIA